MVAYFDTLLTGEDTAPREKDVQKHLRAFLSSPVPPELTGAILPVLEFSSSSDSLPSSGQTTPTLPVAELDSSKDDSFYFVSKGSDSSGSSSSSLSSTKARGRMIFSNNKLHKARILALVSLRKLFQSKAKDTSPLVSPEPVVIHRPTPMLGIVDEFGVIH